MTTTPIGDLAQFLTTRNRVSQAQRDLARTTSEVSSGVKNDIGAFLKGDFSRLAAVERGLRLTEGYRNGTNLAQSFYTGMQLALERAQDEVVELGPRLRSASGTGQSAQLLTTAVPAEAGFNAVVQALNTQNGGRSPFAGTATNSPALQAPEDILTALETLVAGAPDAATMITLIDDYFTDPAGGYETTAYLGNTNPQTGFTIDEGEIAQSDITALDPSIRRTLSGLAMAALMSREVGPTDPISLETLGDQAGEWMQEGYQGVTEIRAELGVTQSRVEATLTRHQAALTTLTGQKSQMVDADPFEAAVELQSVETRLETLYLMTARLQRLTLAEYL